MLKINQIKMKLQHTQEDLFAIILQQLKIKKEDVIQWNIEKQSYDARKKPIIFVIYSVSVLLKNEQRVWKRLNNKNNQIQQISKKEYEFKGFGSHSLKEQPVVIGSGPAGLLCAYQLALHGYQPILLERGASVDERVEDVEAFWNTGTLKLNSNVQFGEGGAGTFSDGKLNTGVKDPFGRNRYVLELFVKHGAPENILYDGKPHIGTDILVDMVKNIRNSIIEMGGIVRFHAHVTDFLVDNGKLTGIEINKNEILNTQVAVLAIGHSARDTFTCLYENSVSMEAKSFAVGVRVEHPQTIINYAQYGLDQDDLLPPSPYKLATNLKNGRGVYSFCMCPGGYVVNASSEEGKLAINGMSYSKRDGKHANSAIVITVNPDDYNSAHPLSGMEFQRELEEKAYQCGNGKIPYQLYGDFYKNIPTIENKEVLPEMKGQYKATNIRPIFPEFVNDAICEGMEVFGKKIRGFSDSKTILSGVESRTSSPVKIPRNEGLESNIKGLYPCGEGAGYAGGITSAAIDGMKVFEGIAKYYKPNIL